MKIILKFLLELGRHTSYYRFINLVINNCTGVRLQAPLPCIAPSNRTPTNKGGTYLADFTPITPPMIPPILMCCIKEVEERGINEIGIYRLSGSEADANDILDKFMKVCKPVHST